MILKRNRMSLIWPKSPLAANLSRQRFLREVQDHQPRRAVSCTLASSDPVHPLFSLTLWLMFLFQYFLKVMGATHPPANCPIARGHKDPFGALRGIPTGSEEMAGILLNEGKERKEELLLQAMKILSKSQEASVWTQLVPNTRGTGSKTRVALGLAWVSTGSKIKEIKVSGSDFTGCDPTF